ncbi:hypothetical protein [Streptomyces chrestomyceticus]|uniref:hypothetical protein n=1 Tax=Streptomyces chrestomyceticus TaxID=68185 RepID=UPI0033D746AF
MTPLHFATLSIILYACLSAYGIHQSADRDVRAALRTVLRHFVILVLGCLALFRVDPAEIPSVLWAVTSKL